MTEAQRAQTTEINDGLHRTNVAVFGLDRPGIVAVASNALTRRGVNLEQVNQMALHGQFALMCVIQKPAGLSNEQIQQELEAEIARRKFDLAVMVIDFKAPTPQPESEPYVVSVWGTDRNDIIANFSRIFAEQKINIESLRAFPIEDGMSLQVFEVSIPLNVDRRALHRVMIDRARAMNLRCNLQHRDIFEAIHRVKVE
ncbi:glycine cleavage system protein R [Sutterella wadsworthensis]|uniref:glycine cleavage system protein R n=1 Tax=Sutterella wadsworthensis TaxID=40545 RepID=UPI00307E65D5